MQTENINQLGKDFSLHFLKTCRQSNVIELKKYYSFKNKQKNIHTHKYKKKSRTENKKQTSLMEEIKCSHLEKYHNQF